MFCSIYKWLISQALDSGKPAKSLIRRHLRRCASCREFALFSESLDERSAQDIREILKGYDEALDKKIFLKLSKSPEQKESRSRKPVLIPAVAAASAVLVITISIIWLTAPKSSQPNLLKSIYEIDINQTSLEKRIVNIESPLEEEIKGLRETLNSTAKFLVSCLEQGIGEVPY